MHDPVTKYLARHAEPEVNFKGIKKHYEAAIAIPACRETAGDIHAVTAAIERRESLLVIVVNNAAGPDRSAAELHRALAGEYPSTPLADNVTHVLSGAPDMILVDRFSEGRTISPDRGVGLARKTACDIALALHHRGIVSEPWLYTTDADATLPANFLAGPAPGAVARIANFRHTPEPGLETAALLYDVRLLYHTAGLAWAGSPYAYPTIGSLMSFSPRAYAVVRGVPRRSTGEDFYLLNKLRKEGPIAVDESVLVKLRGRASDRVPVGTGTALARIRQLQDPYDEYRFEHPGCFADMRDFIDGINRLAEEQPAAHRWQDPLFDSFCMETGFYDHYELRRTQSPAVPVMRKHLDDWFDGLKTRQLIHRLRDERHGEVRADQLGTAPFIPGEPRAVPDVRDALFTAVYRRDAARW